MCVSFGIDCTLSLHCETMTTTTLRRPKMFKQPLIPHTSLRPHRSLLIRVDQNWSAYIGMDLDPKSNSLCMKYEKYLTCGNRSWESLWTNVSCWRNPFFLSASQQEGHKGRGVSECHHYQTLRRHPRSHSSGKGCLRYWCDLKNIFYIHDISPSYISD